MDAAAFAQQLSATLLPPSQDDQEESADIAARVRRAAIARAAQPWFRQFYADQFAAYMKALVRTGDRDGAYEIAVQARVLEEVRTQFEQDLRADAHIVPAALTLRQLFGGAEEEE